MRKSIARPGTFQGRRSTAAIARSAALSLCAGIMPPDSAPFVFRALVFLFFLSACVFFWFVLYRSADYSVYLPLPIPRAGSSSSSSFNNNHRHATFAHILPSEAANSPPVSRFSLKGVRVLSFLMTGLVRLTNISVLSGRNLASSVYGTMAPFSVELFSSLHRAIASFYRF